MPAYNFKRQFTPGLLKGLIELNRGESPPRMDGALEKIAQCWGVDETTRPKRQTIRLCRKRPTKVGETLYLFTGMRTKQCVRLGEAVCKEVRALTLEASGVPGRFFVCLAGVLSFVPLVVDQRFAQADGFKDAAEMMAFFQKTHGLPFHGELITW